MRINVDMTRGIKNLTLYILLVYLPGVARVRDIIKDEQNLVCMVSANKIDHDPV